MENSSSFLGVSWHKTYCEWESYVYIRGRKVTICFSESDVSAAIVRDYVALAIYGDTAVSNLPDQDLPIGISPFFIRSRLHQHGILI